MSAGLTPSDLLEIRRVKAMIAGSAGMINPDVFQGATGATGSTGPAGSIGNYGVPASLAYSNTPSYPQLATSGVQVLVAWQGLDATYSQGTTGLTYQTDPTNNQGGQFINLSATDSMLLNVNGYISFDISSLGSRAVFARLNGPTGTIYGYSHLAAATGAADPTIVPFSFNIFLKASSIAGNVNHWNLTCPTVSLETVDQAKSVLIVWFSLSPELGHGQGSDLSWLRN